MPWYQLACRERQRRRGLTHENQDTVQRSVIVFDILFVRYISFVYERPPDTRIRMHFGTIFVVGILPCVIIVAHQYTRGLL